MSLAALNTAAAANEGRVLTVLHPTERTPLVGQNGKPVTITLLGQDSDIFIKAENAARARAMEHLSEGGKFSPAASDLQACEALARCTLDWSNIPKGWIDGTDDETPAKHSHETAVALYQNPGVKWLRDQTDKFIATRSNFLKASPKP